ncbi:hypothetical protein [Microvirga sp. TS319]|uniref:hypothetical protein n=1 Tax=Microvirga sp. TS319 TaxID=3241165 RepID=UPI00351A0EA7
MKIFVAPDLDAYKDLALSAVDAWTGSRRARPASQASMDAYKLAEAQKVIAGESSRLIEEEARINGIKPAEQAERVIAAASATVDLELDRIQAKAAIRSAKKHADVLQVLTDRGISLPNAR